MNCANHPEVATAAYCQNCGKPLCNACIRSVGGVVYCEPCLAARLSPGVAIPLSGAAPGNMHAHPVLAGLLGFIPGVGAMYNGQFIKALAHVLIFAVFVSLADKNFVFGLLLSAWVFYQVFDAAQTAKARRDGLPLPNPFGLNDLGVRLGMAPAAPYAAGFTPPPAAPYAAGFTPPPAAPYAAGFTAPPPPTGAVHPAGPNPEPTVGPIPGPVAEQTGGWSAVPPPPGYAASYAVPPAAPGMPNPPPNSLYAAPVVPERHRHPLGAIVLIGIGLLLLLNTLGVFDADWIGRAWPLILIAIGGWLLYRRTQENNHRGGF